jgi:hypothetical protein
MGKFSDRGTEATDNTDTKDVRASADGASADFPLCFVDYINPLTPSWRWKQGAYWLLRARGFRARSRAAQKLSCDGQKTACALVCTGEDHHAI